MESQSDDSYRRFTGSKSGVHEGHLEQSLPTPSPPPILQSFPCDWKKTGPDASAVGRDRERTNETTTTTVSWATVTSNYREEMRTEKNVLTNIEWAESAAEQTLLPARPLSTHI